MAGLIFVRGGAAPGKGGKPQRRPVLEHLRGNSVQHRGGNADIGKHAVATQFPAGHKEMSWLLAKKGQRRRSEEGEPAENGRESVGARGWKEEEISGDACTVKK